MSALKIGSVGFIVNMTTEFDIPDGATLTVNIMRPDNEQFSVEATKVGEQVAQMVTAESWFADGMVSMPGTYRVELVCEFDDVRLISQTATITVAGLAA